MPAQRTAGASGRTYGSKAGAAHRIKRSNISSSWLDDIDAADASGASSSLTRPTGPHRLGLDADPLQLHRAHRTAVALAADSSSSADGDSPSRSAAVSPVHTRRDLEQQRVPPTSFYEDPNATSNMLQLSDTDDEDGDEDIVDRHLGSSSPAPVAGRSQSQQRAMDSEESEFESPMAARQSRERTAPQPLLTRRSARASSQPLSEMMTPQASAEARPSKEQAGGSGSSSSSSSSSKFKSASSDRKRTSSQSRSQSPMLTTNGARATEALADVIRRSKRPRKSTYRSELAEEPIKPRLAGATTSDSESARGTRRNAPAAAAVPAASSSSRSTTRSASTSTRATAEADAGSKEKDAPLRSTMNALRSLALDPKNVPRKSNSLITVDVPMWKATPDRPNRPRLSRLSEDNDPTPRPEVRRLRSSVGNMPSSDPDSLRGVRGSSPVKTRRASTHNYKEDTSDVEEVSEEDEDSEEEEEDDEDLSDADRSQREAAAMEMSKRDHSTILGPDLKAVDENMTTLLAVCGQKTFIPFSKVLSLLGADPAPAKKKSKGSKAGSPTASGALVKIGEATYSEVFRLTTQVAIRRGRLVKGKAVARSGGAAGSSETWEERKVLKIVPIRKDKPSESERQHILPSAVAASLVMANATTAPTSASASAEPEEGGRRRGARARVPSQKRVEREATVNEEQEKARRRKRARERVSTGPELSTARDVQREIEVTRALGRLNPDGGAGGAFGSFVKLHAAHIVAGPYPRRLLEAWDEYHEQKEGGSENWRPDVLENDQIFAVIVLGDGGRNLEHSELQTWQQAASIFWQLVHAIATAEMAIQFEHRDLHWGNVLISPKPPEIEPLRSTTLKQKSSALSVLASPRSAARQAPSLVSATSTVHFLARAAERAKQARDADRGGGISTRRSAGSSGSALLRPHSGASNDFARALEAQNAGIYATIIDFALSRVILEPGEGLNARDDGEDIEIRQKRILAYDFDDEEIFEGKGDPQFDVYRDMRDLVDGDWHTFRPITNVMWLSFFVEKLTATRKLKQLTFKSGKNYLGDEHRERYFYFFLRHCQRRIHDSVEDVLETAFDARDAAAKAKRTGRPLEEFLPKKNGNGTASNGKGAGGANEKASPKPLSSAKALLRWMRREVERLEDGFHAGDE